MKFKIENNQIVDGVGLMQPNLQEYIDNGYNVDEVIPVYDPNLQYLGERYYDEINNIVTWTLLDISQAELDARALSVLERLDKILNVESIKRILQKLIEPILEDEVNLTEQDIIDATAVYKQWRSNINYTINDKVVYNSELYKVVQAHTSQPDWTPDVVPALFIKFVPAGVIAEWVQPLGAQDAYQIDDKVTHNGFTWISITANNVWEPGVYGWTQI